METRTIGSLNVPVVGLGCNNFGRRLDASRTAEVVDAAIDAGVTFFDTADVYGQGQSEEYLGKALGGRRGQVLIATKFGSSMQGFGEGGRPEYIHKAVEASLRRLGTDYIDLYQIHRPDAKVPIADTLAALNELVQAGKVREIGCSNFSTAQLEEAESARAQGAARFVSVQNEYSLMHREPEKDVLATCERLGIAFIPYFPLANGLLTGKYRKGQPAPEGTRIEASSDALNEQNLAIVENLVTFAESRGHTLLELAFSWLLSQPTVASVIAGATKPEQVRANGAAAAWQLSPDEVAEVNSMVL